MVLASDGDALMGAWFDGQRHQPPVGSSWLRRRNLPILLRAASSDEYFAGGARVRTAFSARARRSSAIWQDRRGALARRSRTATSRRHQAPRASARQGRDRPQSFVDLHPVPSHRGRRRRAHRALAESTQADAALEHLAQVLLSEEGAKQGGAGARTPRGARPQCEDPTRRGSGACHLGLVVHLHRVIAPVGHADGSLARADRRAVLVAYCRIIGLDAELAFGANTR
jgi:hypothetical protein